MVFFYSQHSDGKLMPKSFSLKVKYESMIILLFFYIILKVNFMIRGPPLDWDKYSKCGNFWHLKHIVVTFLWKLLITFWTQNFALFMFSDELVPHSGFELYLAVPHSYFLAWLRFQCSPSVGACPLAEWVIVPKCMYVLIWNSLTFH